MTIKDRNPDAKSDPGLGRRKGSSVAVTPIEMAAIIACIVATCLSVPLVVDALRALYLGHHAH